MSDQNNNYFDFIEKEGLKNLLVYFNRIQDKLFSFNNILIISYFALAKLEDSIPIWLIIMPILNMILILFIEFLNLKKSRFESNIKDQNIDSLTDEYRKMTENINLYSLVTILSTSIVLGVFLWQLISKH